MRGTLESAARPEGEGRTACQTVKLQVFGPKLSNIFGLILHCLDLIVLLKPEVEEEVAEHQFLFSLVHLSPPLFSPQETHAVRRATPQSASRPLLRRSKI